MAKHEPLAACAKTLKTGRSIVARWNFSAWLNQTNSTPPKKSSNCSRQHAETKKSERGVPTEWLCARSSVISNRGIWVATGAAGADDDDVPGGMDKVTQLPVTDGPVHSF